MTQDKRKQRGFSRRKFMQSAAAASAAAAGGAALGGAAQAKSKKPNLDPDVILQNGKIHTMDAKGTIASSVAIKDGRFIQVESGRSHLRGPQDAGRQPARSHRVPGIIDNHNHIVLMGNRPGFHTPLENAYSIADVQATYARRAREVPAGAWITTIGGFHRNHFYAADETPRLPTLAELDSGAPDHPVYISDRLQRPGGPTASARRSSRRRRSRHPGRAGRLHRGGGFGDSPTRANSRCVRRCSRSKRASGAYATPSPTGSAWASPRTWTRARSRPPALRGRRGPRGQLHDAPAVPVGPRGRRPAGRGCGSTSCTWSPTRRPPSSSSDCATQFPFFGDDMIRTGGIGEFIAQGTGPTFVGGRAPGGRGRLAGRGPFVEHHRLPGRDPGIRGGERASSPSPTCAGSWPTCRSSPRSTSTGSTRSAAACRSRAGGTWPARRPATARRSG